MVPISNKRPLLRITAFHSMEIVRVETSWTGGIGKGTLLVETGIDGKKVL